MCCAHCCVLVGAIQMLVGGNEVELAHALSHSLGVSGEIYERKLASCCEASGTQLIATDILFIKGTIIQFKLQMHLLDASCVHNNLLSLAFNVYSQLQSL